MKVCRALLAAMKVCEMFARDYRPYFSALNKRLDSQDQTQARILALLTQFKQENQKNMAALDDQITALTNDVTQETTVEQSAITLINGIPALIANAVAQAQAAGATPAQLQALTDLGTKITASSAALGTAVTTNTPAAPAQTAPATT